MVLPGHFQPFRLESEWPYVLLYPLFPCVPVASVVYVVVIDQASPEYPARLDWHLWLDSSSDFRVRQQLLASGDSRVCYAIIKDKAAAPLRAYLRDGQWGDAPNAAMEKNLPDASAGRCGNMAGTTGDCWNDFSRYRTDLLIFPAGCTILDLIRTI